MNKSLFPASLRRILHSSLPKDSSLFTLHSRRILHFSLFPLPSSLFPLPFSLFTLLSVLPLSAQALSEVGLGYAQTSVNTAVFRNSSVVSDGDLQFTAYYDAEGYVTLARRSLLSDTCRWEVKRSPYKGKAADAHNVISIGIDGAGYLHVSFDHHDNPLRYCRSKEPLSLELDTLTPMTGREEDRVTYPEFYRFANGDLLFAYRSGKSGRGNLVLNRWDLASRRWERVQDVLIDGEGRRSAYWQLYVDAAGTIHLSWVWRETWMVETNHDLCYARSTDGGVTWTRSDGTGYDLPIRLSTAEVAFRIPQRSELINQTSMSTDAAGHPYIATYWRDSASQVPQYRVVWHDGKTWHQQQVSRRTTPFSLAGGGTKMIPVARPRIVVDGRRAWYIFRDEERGSRVSMYYTRNLRRGRWKVKDLTDYSVHAWEPSPDMELWKRQRRLHLFVQDTHQGDGERRVETEPTPVRILEVKL